MQTRVPASAEAAKQQSQHAQQPTQLLTERATAFEEHSPQTAQLAALQAVANNGPQSQRMQAMQAKINGSVQLQQMRSVQARMVAGNVGGKVASVMPGDLVQREEMDEPLQAKLVGEALHRGEVAAAADSNLASDAPKPNNTGLPDQLKSGIESLSGMRMDHVKVHYNSDKPAQLQAHAYAQGSDIHVAPGQERHLPHEAWHVVQQAQGRVKPTMQMKGGLGVNDDVGLESEADLMGAKALAPVAQLACGGQDGVGRQFMGVVQKASAAYSAIDVSNPAIPLSRHHMLPRASLAKLWSATIGPYEAERARRLKGDPQSGLGPVDIGEPPSQEDASYAPGVIWVGPTNREKSDDPQKGDVIEARMLGKISTKGLSRQHREALDNIAADIGDGFSSAGASRITWLKWLTGFKHIPYDANDWESQPEWTTRGGVGGAYKFKD